MRKSPLNVFATAIINLRFSLQLLMLLVAQPIVAHAELLPINAGSSIIEFDTEAGIPQRWTICEHSCEDPQARRAELFSPGDGALTFSSQLGPSGNFKTQVESNAEFVKVNFVAATEYRSFRIDRDTARLTLNLSPDTALELATGRAFVPEQLPGFGQIYSRVHLINVSEQGQEITAFDDIETNEEIAATHEQAQWSGIRNRYWAWLASPVTASIQTQFTYAEIDRPILRLRSADPAAELSLELYAGPVEWRSLRAVAPELTELLFAALWDFLRWLTLGMQLLFELIYRFVGNYGVAIILLSLTAKILLYPITALADRWQAEVNKINSLLQPEIARIRREDKGEAAHRRILDVYKRHNVSQWYTLKSAAGFLIQIPVFIAAFDMLAENFALNGIPFLWIQDLAKPDHFAALPWVMPFFGGWLNLLPFLMTGLSVLAAWLQREDTLSPELQRQQSLRLYLMAAAFFVLFYTFPAGMVLYWTSSNLFHLLKAELLPRLRPKGKTS